MFFLIFKEFFQGRLFVEDYECNSIIENNMLNSIKCIEKSKNAINDLSAIVNQQLTFKESRPASSTPTTSN